ncbi:hypothetical protein V6O07_16015, partial [Arthrospira platensis SPKY2]
MAQQITNQTEFKKYLKWFWGIFAGGILCIVLLFTLAAWGVFGEMPTFDELENPDSNLATDVIGSDGVSLGRFYRENRTPVK